MAGNPILGKNMARLRGNRSQEEVAQSIGISRARYSHYETARSEPDHEVLESLANYFGVSTDYLLGLTDDPKPISIYTSSGFLEKALRTMKSQRGQATIDSIPLLLIEMAKLYAVSKGVPTSAIMSHLSEESPLSEEEKNKLAREIDRALNEEPDPASELAKEIESLPTEERKAMETMLEVLRKRNEGAAAYDPIAANQDGGSDKTLRGPAARSEAEFKKAYREEMLKKKQK